MKNFIAAMLAGVVFVSGAAAQNSQLMSDERAAAKDPVSNPNTIILNFSVDTLGPILNELGVAWQAYKTNQGQAYIDANFAGVLNFRLVPAACSGAGYSDCVGLSMLSGFTGLANAQTVNAFNYRFSFATAGLDPSGAAYLTRYEISDYGISRGNVATSIMVFLQQSAFFADELASARQTVALDGYANDLAASQLNRQVRQDITGVPVHAHNPIAQHQLGLDETAELVSQFIKDKSAPKNKIINNVKQ